MRSTPPKSLFRPEQTRHLHAAIKTRTIEHPTASLQSHQSNYQTPHPINWLIPRKPKRLTKPNRCQTQTQSQFQTPAKPNRNENCSPKNPDNNCRYQRGRSRRYTDSNAVINAASESRSNIRKKRIGNNAAGTFQFNGTGLVSEGINCLKLGNWNCFPPTKYYLLQP